MHIRPVRSTLSDGYSNIFCL